MAWTTTKRQVRVDLQPPSGIAADVVAGLRGRPKSLPPHLFYDAPGSELFERITELPEYYLTRAERSILETQGDSILGAVQDGGGSCEQVVELGAGTATKSQLLLRAIRRRGERCSFLPVDVSRTALEQARTRIVSEEPGVAVHPLEMRNEEALAILRRTAGRSLVLFIGSSIGNYDPVEALSLLEAIRSALAPGGALLLGTDRRKSPDILVPAYDDAQGVTAAFNKNVLARINRELGGKFDLDRFRHVAVWNDGESRMEMHLESTVDQIVPVAGVGLEFAFRRGERVHTESSYKYELSHVDRLLSAAGFRRDRTFDDEGRLFWLHLARAV